MCSSDWRFQFTVTVTQHMCNCLASCIIIIIITIECSAAAHTMKRINLHGLKADVKNPLGRKQIRLNNEKVGKG